MFTFRAQEALEKEMRLVEQLESNPNIARMEKEKAELEERRHQIIADTKDLEFRQQELGLSLSNMNAEIQAKTELLQSLQHKSTFLTKSTQAFNNVLKHKSQHQSAIKEDPEQSMRRTEIQRLLELAHIEVQIIQTTIKCEMLKKECRDRDEEEKRLKTKIIDVKYRVELVARPGDDYENMHPFSEDQTVRQSDTESITLEEQERRSVQSLSIRSGRFDSLQLDRQSLRGLDFKQLSIKSPKKFLRPGNFPPIVFNEEGPVARKVESCNDAPSCDVVMSEFERELFHSAKSSKYNLRYQALHGSPF